MATIVNSFGVSSAYSGNTQIRVYTYVALPHANHPRSIHLSRRLDIRKLLVERASQRHTNLQTLRRTGGRRMKKQKERYIIYANEEYLNRLFNAQGAETTEEQDKIRYQIFTRINQFLRGDDYDCKTIFCDSITTKSGETAKGIEIYRLSNGARIKSLDELRKLMNSQKKKGFVELKKPLQE